MKKIRNEIAVIGLLFVLSVAASNAMAATTSYDLSAAIADPLYYGGSGDHAFVVGGQDYLFAPGAGSLIQFDDGTAILSGVAYNASNPGSGFNVNILLQGLTTAAPPDSPKKELLDSAYTENGGPVDTGTWSYYTSFSGTFDGIGDLAGTVLQITPRGPTFQIGAGADNKNIEFGASAWFWAEDAHGNVERGDFNLELRVVPVPAALPLLISALVATGFAGRRRRKSV